MAQQVKRGTTNLKENPMQGGLDRKNGGQTTRTFTGDQTSIITQANLMYAQGYTVQYTGGPVWKLTATLPYDLNLQTTETMPEPTWEIEGQPTEQNILETDATIVTGLSTTTKTLIEARIKNPNSVAPLTTTSEVSQLTNATKVYNLMRIGVDGKRIYVPTVKRTITVSVGFSGLTWTLAYVGQVLSYSQFTTNFSVPTYIQSLLNGSAFVTDTAGIQTFTGYLIEYPTVSYIGNNKVQISQNFIYNKWSTDLYTIVN